MNPFKTKKGLGRGLASLIGDVKTSSKNNKLLIGDIVRSKLQPRKNFDKLNLEELSNSIKERGVVQPIIVRNSNEQKGKYEIVAGERRWLASQNAGLHDIPAVIIEADDLKSLEFAIVENVQRQDLNSIEEAEGYKRLMNEFNYNQEKLSQFIGKSRSYITNTLRLLSLSSEVINYVENGLLSAGHARALIGIDNAKDVAKQIIDKKLSVRQAEQLAKVLKKKNINNKIYKKNINIIALEKSLEEKTGFNTSIYNKKNNTGKVSFEYKSLDQLERLVSVIKKNY